LVVALADLKPKLIALRGPDGDARPCRPGREDLLLSLAIDDGDIKALDNRDEVSIG